MRVPQRKLFVKSQEKNFGPTDVMGVMMGKCFRKKFPLPSEKTNTKSESSDVGSGRESKSQKKKKKKKMVAIAKKHY